MFEVTQQETMLTLVIDLVRNYCVDRCFQSELILNHNLSSSRNHKLISMLITFVIPNIDLNMLILEILLATTLENTI